MPLPGALPMFRLFGVRFHLHWLWLVFVVAELASADFRGRYSYVGWNVAECLTLLGVVLAHEFAHALACRSVGGRADDVVLWPLGGLLFAEPPRRPGPMFWTIAAGPLVNVMLMPAAWSLALGLNTVPALAGKDVTRFGFAVAYLNTAMLLLNLLPIYPLDGGQALRGLLGPRWGEGVNLRIAAGLGLVAAAAAAATALAYGHPWFALLAACVGFEAWGGFRLARSLTGEDGRAVPQA